MTGDFGVGTDAPGAPVEILHSTVDHTSPHLILNSENGSGQNTIQLQHDGALHSKIRGAGGGDLFIGTHTNGDLKFYANAGAELDDADEIKMLIGPAGNVGIGTLTPDEKLSVAGVIESTVGGIKFPDGTVQASAATGGGSSGPLVATIVKQCEAGGTCVVEASAGITAIEWATTGLRVSRGDAGSMRGCSASGSLESNGPHLGQGHLVPRFGAAIEDMFLFFYNAVDGFGTIDMRATGFMITIVCA
jgi:hypothetical protein